ncbi:hypothetical protein ACUXZJ_05965 [Flavobacterium sp. TN-1]
MKNKKLDKCRLFLEIANITQKETELVTSQTTKNKTEILEAKIETVAFDIIKEIVEFVEEIKDCKYNYKGGFTAIFENHAKHYNNEMEFLIDEQKHIFENKLQKILNHSIKIFEIEKNNN